MKLAQAIAERKPDSYGEIRAAIKAVEIDQERKQYRRRLQKYVLKNRDRMLFNFLVAAMR